MIRRIILTLITLIIGINTSKAEIDIVYPTQKELTVNAESIFFVGNTEQGSEFYINSEPVKLWENIFFVHTIPLEYGRNRIELKSIKNNKVDTQIYTIKRNRLSIEQNNKKIKYEKKDKNDIIYTKTIKDNSTIRSRATQKSERIVDLPPNIILYLEAELNDYYKIEENGDKEFWIHKSNISKPVKLSLKTKAKLKNMRYYEDELYNYNKFYLSHPVLYTVKQDNKTIILTLYGVENTDTTGKILENYTHTFELETKNTAYDCYYDENSFIFRMAKKPEIIDIKTPLKDINIFIDAGHGGKEKGAIGPTRIFEKDINLSITNYLTEMLKKDGANIITSREDDTTISLLDRVKIAKNNNAYISLSIHNNSLPNGKNPYEKHGTEVHYYNENARELAEIINKNLANDLSLKNGGVYRSSFALNRSTSPISVLIEVAYMINPSEYILLRNTQFQRNVAKSIKKSLEEYIISIQEKEL